jgi:2-oxoglutarate ferredoxin oxidoreductase subunit alpha
MEKQVLIGGEAGEGIKEAANLLAKVLVNLGYYAFTYHDYPSLIRGGHNFSTVRFSNEEVLAPAKTSDIIVALNQESYDRHREELKEGGVAIVDLSVEAEKAVKVPFKKLTKGVTTSSAVLGALLKAFKLPVEEGEAVVKELPNPQENLRVLRAAYQEAQEVEELIEAEGIKGEYFSGSEGIALGAVDGGLDLYVAYPMTPASPVLHFLAKHKKELGIKVIQPENEIGVINFALGAAYAGAVTMTGTSGGGFALMTETLSLAGMSETPVVIYEAQRAGPSTGVPTYTEQADLLFVLFAGHGDFPKVVVGPSTAAECYQLTKEALKIAWKYQLPVVVLSSKNVAESFFTEKLFREQEKAKPLLWDGKGEYRRYEITENGVSPMAFPGTKGAVVKANSYEHDPYGITTEEPKQVKEMKEKRQRKWEALKEELLSDQKWVKVGGDLNSDRVIVTWGENWGACKEVGELLGYKVVKPSLLLPFPEQRVKEELEGAKEVVVVELSIGGQFEKLLKLHGIEVSKRFRKYDARPIFVEELTQFLRG